MLYRHDSKPLDLYLARPPRRFYSGCLYTTCICYNMSLLASPLVSRTIGQRGKRKSSEFGFMPLSYNLRTILRYTHTAEFSEFFLCM